MDGKRSAVNVFSPLFWGVTALLWWLVTVNSAVGLLSGGQPALAGWLSWARIVMGGLVAVGASAAAFLTPKHVVNPSRRVVVGLGFLFGLMIGVAAIRIGETAWAVWQEPNSTIRTLRIGVGLVWGIVGVWAVQRVRDIFE